jgi:ABC-2 type transport system ATP-binding protein
MLFLDEPTTGFDPAARRAAWETIELQCDGGMTVVLTTHYLEEAERLADRVVVVVGGRVVADAPPERVSEIAGRGSVVHFPVPEGAGLPTLPAGDVALENGWATLRTDDLAPTLEELLDWARVWKVNLDQLTVSQSTLEDAYMALTADGDNEGRHHEGA